MSQVTDEQLHTLTDNASTDTKATLLYKLASEVLRLRSAPSPQPDAKLLADIREAVDLLLAINKDMHARNPMAVTAIDMFLATRALSPQEPAASKSVQKRIAAQKGYPVDPLLAAQKDGQDDRRKGTTPLTADNLSAFVSGNGPWKEGGIDLQIDSRGTVAVSIERNGKWVPVIKCFHGGITAHTVWNGGIDAALDSQLAGKGDL